MLLIRRPTSFTLRSEDKDVKYSRDQSCEVGFGVSGIATVATMADSCELFGSPGACFPQEGEAGGARCCNTPLALWMGGLRC